MPWNPALCTAEEQMKARRRDFTVSDEEVASSRVAEQTFDGACDLYSGETWGYQRRQLSHRAAAAIEAFDGASAKALGPTIPA